MYSKGNLVPGFAPAVAIAPPPPPPPHAAGPDRTLVKAVQTELVRLNYLDGTADGSFGPKTRTAISGFEQAKGLPVDGRVSSGLLAKLQSTPTSAAATSNIVPTGWVAPAKTQAMDAGTAAPSASSAPGSAPAAAGWVAPKP
jgi:peptidoglycan hydrolase-like protein with peptidoglycan-binding domain